MKRIALLSDTHGYLDSRWISHLNEVDEIWHAGDIGTLEVAIQLSALKPLRAVHGNIDGHPVKTTFPADQQFNCEEMTVWIRHIGGYPGHYEKSIREILFKNPPKLFITGHSHILKVMYDHHLQLLHINPGAAGKYGFHTVQTLVKFCIEHDRILNLEIVEITKK
jgi:putative phosphoesterase